MCPTCSKKILLIGGTLVVPPFLGHARWISPRGVSEPFQIILPRSIKDLLTAICRIHLVFLNAMLLRIELLPLSEATGYTVCICHGHVHADLYSGLRM